ncbi:MAG: tRNA (guanosine(46)-N7)-methyltransferase TrmB [Planctomycetota bacterium]
MGRRALRKIDPNLELSSWFRREEDLPEALPHPSLFGRIAPLEIEIGTGKGLFLDHATAACPDHDFLGIEVRRKYARFAAATLAKRERTNAKVIHGEGARILAQRVQTASISAIHVYFPDPWWKKRHRKRRVMNEGFLQQVERVLQPGGMLHFWTDVCEYYESTLDFIDRITDLQGPEIPPEQPATHDTDYRTHFERRTRQHDLPVYRSLFRKP